MPDTTSEERIATLEQQVEDLASFVGRLTAGVYGDRFEHSVPEDDEHRLLVWTEVLSDPGTEDECVVGWWTYNEASPAVAVDA